MNGCPPNQPAAPTNWWQITAACICGTIVAVIALLFILALFVGMRSLFLTQTPEPRPAYGNYAQPYVYQQPLVYSQNNDDGPSRYFRRVDDDEEDNDIDIFNIISPGSQSEVPITRGSRGSRRRPQKLQRRKRLINAY